MLRPDVNRLLRFMVLFAICAWNGGYNEKNNKGCVIGAVWGIIRV